MMKQRFVKPYEEFPIHNHEPKMFDVVLYDNGWILRLKRNKKEYEMECKKCRHMEIRHYPFACLFCNCQKFEVRK